MIDWFHRVVLHWIQDVMNTARTNYGVNPVVFLVIYVVSVPFFYYSIVRMVKAAAQRRPNEVMIWSTVFLASTAAPFLYVLFFGHNLPWWVYVIIGLLLAQGVFSLVRRLKGSASPGKSPPPRA
jgi:hypothetical protein